MMDTCEVCGKKVSSGDGLCYTEGREYSPLHFICWDCWRKKHGLEQEAKIK
jgi:predicted amidophosphoribosyltransferase